MSFRKILVAVDASPQAQVVFEQALELAKKESASLMLFHGIEIAAKLTYLTELEVKTQEAQGLLQTYQQKAKDQGIATEVNYRPGGTRAMYLQFSTKLEGGFNCDWS